MGWAGGCAGGRGLTFRRFARDGRGVRVAIVTAELAKLVERMADENPQGTSGGTHCVQDDDPYAATRASSLSAFSVQISCWSRRSS